MCQDSLVGSKSVNAFSLWIFENQHKVWGFSSLSRAFYVLMVLDSMLGVINEFKVLQN